jgi:hypothetical protein
MTGSEAPIPGSPPAPIVYSVSKPDQDRRAPVLAAADTGSGGDTAEAGWFRITCLLFAET